MLNPNEVKRAIIQYNRMQEGDSTSEINLAAIERLENLIEDLILTMREVSNLIDESYDLWQKGNIQPVVTAAATVNDYPENSSYPKGWWLQTMIPQIQAMKTHLETENGSGISPNEVFFSKPPKKGEVVEESPTP